MRVRIFAQRAVWGVSLLLALVGGPTGPAGIVHFSLDDDPACHVPVVAGGGVLPLLSPHEAGSDLAAGHCGTCHGLCSLRYQAPPLGLSGLSEQSLGLVSVAMVHWVDDASPVQLPARAPPSLRA